jgi:protein-L-isoaspartate(D-aspartate) O-methyltransferase
MVDNQIAARGVRDTAVLGAMREVPRERFVPEPLGEFAYEDTPLPIEAGQTISQPYIVAYMIEAAAIGADDRVLEIGAGSGYAAAVISRIARQVHAIERHPELAELARARMAALGYTNVDIRTGDGTRGLPEAAPFDAILIAAGGPSIPKPLCRQLAVGGRLVMPVGDADLQKLVRATRTADDRYDEEDIGDVRFVPLIGAHGWAEDRGAGVLVEPVPIGDAAANGAARRRRKTYPFGL